MAAVIPFKRYQLFQANQSVVEFLNDIEDEIGHLAKEHDRLTDLVLNAEILSQVEIYWNQLAKINVMQEDLYYFMMDVVNSSIEYSTY